MPQIAPVWSPAPWQPILANDDVHIWCVSLEQEPARVEAFFRTLSPDEQARAQRFYFERDRRHFTVARGVLRDILSRYLPKQPYDMLFAYGPKGKPTLAPDFIREVPRADTLYFNLSHSGTLALYGFTRGRDIGVDIERIRELEDAEQIATRFFSQGEVRVFCALPAASRMQGFFNCWSRKESYIKATGDGLSMPLDRFEVSLIPGEPARFLHVLGDPAEAARWSLHALYPAPDYAAALCVEGHDWEIHCWSWTPQETYETLCH